MQSQSALKAYNYRIYPIYVQVFLFVGTLGYPRFIWKKMIGEKLRTYDKKRRIP